MKITIYQKSSDPIANGSKLTKADFGRVINKEKKQLQIVMKQTII